MFCNRIEDMHDMPSYHFFKLIIGLLLFGFIMMFNTVTSLFLVSFDTDYIHDIG